ncbi:pyridoxal phosphate-dependent transferase [Aspergillus karnatakaensis]|uniref:putative aminotransferase family protein (LolT) n=1 Tax=Aspergillus karnatakaensis TaxID=1810916 RepID=UPI003CCDC794
MTSSAPAPTPFGNPMKKQFLIDPNFRNLNHGSFGTYPTTLLNTQRTLQKACESRPDIFIRYTQPDLIDASRASLASYLNTSLNELVLVRNATTGVNTILHNLVLTKTLTDRDAVIYFETVYGGVERSLFAIKEGWGVQLRKVKFTFPIGEEELVRKFREVVEGARRDGLRPRVAVFETIVSNPGMWFPFERLIQVCKEEGVLSLIDGAHGVGHVRLDLGKGGNLEGADFWTSNCHKWLYTPRSCAVLYVPTRHQHLIRTSLPTSWGYNPPASTSSEEDDGLLPSVLPVGEKPAFVTLFEFTGTADDSAYSCVPAALKFRKEICGGEEAIFNYLEELADVAGDVVAKALGTEILAPVSGEKVGCGMVNVRLPIKIASVAVGEEEKGVHVVRAQDVSALGHWFHEQLVEKGTFVPVFAHGDWFYTRLSAQVYLEKSDFEWLGAILKEILRGLEGFLGALKVPAKL